MDENIEPVIPMLIRRMNHLESLVIETHNNVLEILKEKQKELLTPTEICKMLKISRDTYQEYAKSKLFQQIQLVPNGRMYVQRSEIERLIEQGKV